MKNRSPVVRLDFCKACIFLLALLLCVSLEAAEQPRLALLLVLDQIREE